MIINLTQHQATAEQTAIGVVNLEGEELKMLKQWITFPAVYTTEQLKSAAKQVAKLAWRHWDYYCAMNASKDERPLHCTDDEHQNHWYHEPKLCMIGGMPSFMKHLEAALLNEGFRVGYACTARVSVDKPDGKGGVEKTAVFKHVDMYWAN